MRLTHPPPNPKEQAAWGFLLFGCVGGVSTLQLKLYSNYYYQNRPSAKAPCAHLEATAQQLSCGMTMPEVPTALKLATISDVGGFLLERLLKDKLCAATPVEMF